MVEIHEIFYREVWLQDSQYRFVFLHTTYSTALNDLRKIICLGKSEVSVERISYCNEAVVRLKIWWSMAYTVCHAPMPMTS